MTATTDSSGAFVLNGLVAGRAYTIVARHSGYLPATKQNAVPPAGGLSLPVTVLKAGDIDGNQQITIVDISRVSTDYGGVSAATDVNGNGSVDIVDISLVSTNYGQSGPTNW